MSLIRTESKSFPFFLLVISILVIVLSVSNCVVYNITKEGNNQISSGWSWFMLVVNAILASLAFLAFFYVIRKYFNKK